MEIRNLRTFLQVVENGSFTQAAEVLGYTQATVSVQISQLEEELGCTLFDRIGHKIFLTSRGKQLLHHALTVNDSVNHLLDDFREEESPSGTVHMYSSDSICERMMLESYIEFSSTYPQIHLIFDTGSTTNLLDVLERNQADVVFVLDKKVFRPNFVIAGEQPVRLHFVAAADHPLKELSKTKKLMIQDLMQYPFILTERGLSYRSVLDDALMLKKLKITPSLETGRTDIIIKAVASGQSIAFLPEFTISEAVRRGELAILEVEDFDITIWKQLIYRKDKWISKALRSFLDFVLAHEFQW